MSLRWKKAPEPKGLAAVACGEQGHDLWMDVDEKTKVRVAHAGPVSRHRPDAQWYWMARHDGPGPVVPWYNTSASGELSGNVADAKAAAMAYVRSHLKVASGRVQPAARMSMNQASESAKT